MKRTYLIPATAAVLAVSLSLTGYYQRFKASTRKVPTTASLELNPHTEGVENSSGGVGGILPESTVRESDYEAEVSKEGTASSQQLPEIPVEEKQGIHQDVFEEVPNEEKTVEAGTETNEESKEEKTSWEWSGKVFVAHKWRDPKLAFINDFWEEVKGYLRPGQRVEIENNDSNRKAVLTVVRDQPWQEMCKTLPEGTYVDPCGKSGLVSGLIYSSHVVWFDHLELIIDFNELKAAQDHVINMTFREVAD